MTVFADADVVTLGNSELRRNVNLESLGVIGGEQGPRSVFALQPDRFAPGNHHRFRAAIKAAGRFTLAVCAMAHARSRLMKLHHHARLVITGIASFRFRPVGGPPDDELAFFAESAALFKRCSQ